MELYPILGSSCNVLYQYLKDIDVISVGNFPLWDSVVDYIIDGFNNIFNLTLSVDFTSSILFSIAVNLGIRVFNKICQMISSLFQEDSIDTFIKQTGIILPIHKIMTRLAYHKTKSKSGLS